MSNVTLLDKTFKPYLPSADIQQGVVGIANKINTDYKDKDPLFVCILNGAFMFASDLLKQISLNCQITFVKVASYHGTSSSGKVTKLIGLTENLRDRNVVIVEDIIDTGTTLYNLLPGIEAEKPASLEIASLLYKPDAVKVPLKVKYRAFEIPNDFIVGYGLDYNGYGRNLPDIYQVV